MTTSNNIVGVTGTFASGKDTLAEYLEEHEGWLHVSTGDIVREETQKKFGRKDREILHEHANWMRHNLSPGVLMEMALDKFKLVQGKYKGLVVSGVRSIGEVEVLKAAGGKMIFVDADIRTRYERAAQRQRNLEDSLSFEDFKASEVKEMKRPAGNKTDQNIFGIKQVADEVVTNDGTLDEFIAKSLNAIGR